MKKRIARGALALLLAALSVGCGSGGETNADLKDMPVDKYVKIGRAHV